MSAIASSFVSPFPATGQLGLSLTSIEGGVGSDPNATAILAASASDSSSAFSIISANSATTSTSPTINALTTGELSTEDHTVIAAIGATAGNSLLVPWNANGTAPSTITAIQSLGWIKLASVETAPGSQAPTGANYSLTPVGQAIYKRTVATILGQGTQSTIANASAASTASASAIDSGLASQVSTLIGALSSVGVNVQV
jgi:hypothetical protein